MRLVYIQISIIYYFISYCYIIYAMMKELFYYWLVCCRCLVDSLLFVCSFHSFVADWGRYWIIGGYTRCHFVLLKNASDYFSDLGNQFAKHISVNRFGEAGRMKTALSNGLRLDKCQHWYDFGGVSQELHPPQRGRYVTKMRGGQDAVDDVQDEKQVELNKP